MLAHDWADWEATKRSYELFARYVLPRFEERSLWRSQSVDWMPRQSRNVQRQTQGRRSQCRRAALRRRPNKKQP
jgi:limonene 1,2-monooxygenase